MENWSVQDDDRRYLEPARHSNAWFVVAMAIALVAGIGGYYYYYLRGHQAQPAQVTGTSPETINAPGPQAGPQPAIRHSLETPQGEAATSLPALDNSDSMVRDSIAGLIGGKAFADFVVPNQLVRRIVATIDNLPRPTAPRRMMPLNPVPGAFVTAGANDEATIDSANFARYVPYVRVVELTDVHALAYSYVRAYPLFQRAYEELGNPGSYFNDRLIEAIDNMLVAPEIDTSIKLLRPRILYEFADPDLETRSAGQKIMIRMGKENALKVKAKLRELRRELMAASQRRQ